MGEPVAPTPGNGLAGAESTVAARGAAPVEGGAAGPFGPRYSLLQRIGGGGIGAVHLAYDHHLERFVAIKRLRPDRATPAAVQLFHDEARAVARLRHNAIVAVYEVLAEGASGVALVMELVEGTSLRQRIRRDGPVPLEEAVRLVAEVGRALAYAHGQGVVHRDVKPSNILIGPGERPKLLDFGVAHVAGQPGPFEPGTKVGTLGYAAPEQAAGQPIDHRADVFALGMTLRETVTGSRPDGAPAPPLPHPGLAAIVDRATRTDPGERYPQMADMVHALESLVPAAAQRPDTTPLPDRPPLAPACLRRLDGPAEAFPLPPLATIGRSPRATLRIRHPTLSRVHAKVVRRRTGEAYVFDLGSLNGVRVDGKPMQSGPLPTDGVLGVGEIRFRFEEGRHAAVGAPPPMPSREATTEPALKAAEPMAPPAPASPPAAAPPREDMTPPTGTVGPLPG